MIVVPGRLDPPAGRLVATFAARGHAVHVAGEALPARPGPITLAVADGPFVFDLASCVAACGPRPVRVLVLSRLGAHPDARAATLQRLWRVEEHVRASGLPVLTLRLAPLVGPDSPLVRQLAARPALPRGGRQLVNPVAEADAIETIARALDGRAAWTGWYEVAGADAMTLAELADLSAASDAARTGGAWEPPLEEIAEHRLAESEPWASHFGLVPARVSDVLARRAA